MFLNSDTHHRCYGSPCEESVPEKLVCQQCEYEPHVKAITEQRSLFWHINMNNSATQPNFQIILHSNKQSFKTRSWISQFSIIAILFTNCISRQIDQIIHIKPGTISPLTNMAILYSQKPSRSTTLLRKDKMKLTSLESN